MNLRTKTIPDQLQNLQQWVLWKTETRGGKPTKLPYKVTGSLASSTDPATWTNFKAAIQLADKYSGIGFVFTKEDAFCGVDLDGCRDPKTGIVAEWAKAIILDFDSYAEVSPSETGVKIFIRGKLPFENGKKTSIDTLQVVDDKEPGIEVYDWGRYFAVTGMKLKGMPDEPQDRQSQLAVLCAKHFGEPAQAAQRGAQQQTRLTTIERARKYMDSIPGAISGQSGHNQTFTVACVLILGFCLTKTEAFVLLSEYNQRCEPQWNEKELRHKLDSADNQAGERGYLRDSQNPQAVPLPKYDPPPMPTTLPKESTSPIRVTTIEDAAEKYLVQIESGKQSLVEMGIGDLDYALGGGVEFGEMIIVAARPSHGKSMFALQIMHHFAALKLKGMLVSEEMSALALGKRTVQFASDTPEEYWRHELVAVRSEMSKHFADRAKCWIIEGCGKAEKVVDEIRRLVKTEGVQAVAIDYAQLLGSKGGSRYEQITQTSIALRQVANETNVILLVLCQLSRAVEGRTKFMPKMEDLKDTGQLEQDADVVMFLVWPHRLDSKHDPKDFQIYIAKNRNRSINQRSVDCEFQPSRQRVLPPPHGADTLEWQSYPDGEF